VKIPKIHKRTLANGLRVLVVPRRGFFGASVVLGLRAGSRRETKEINGTAHFLEHMFFRGGSRYLTQVATTAAIEGEGGDFNAFTEPEFAYFTIDMPASKLEIAMDVLSDMLLNAQLREEDIDMERGGVLRELARDADMPGRVAQKEVFKLMYGDTSLGRSAIGTRENVERFSRSDFVSFRKRMYNAQEAVLAIAGDVSLEDTYQLVSKYFSDLSPTSSDYGLPNEPFLTSLEPQVVIWPKKFSEVAIVMGAPAPTFYSQDRPAASILNYVLGDGVMMSSRLFQNVRSAKGLAYTVESYYSNGPDYGIFECLTSVDPERTEEAVEAIAVEIRKLIEEPPSADELKCAMSFRAGTKTMASDYLFTITSSLMQYELRYDKTKTALDEIRDTDNVTREDVSRIAADIFLPGGWKVAIVGPYSGNAETIIDILKTTLKV